MITARDFPTSSTRKNNSSFYMRGRAATLADSVYRRPCRLETRSEKRAPIFLIMIYAKFTRLDGGFPLRNGIYGSYEPLSNLFPMVVSRDFTAFSTAFEEVCHATSAVTITSTKNQTLRSTRILSIKLLINVPKDSTGAASQLSCYDQWSTTFFLGMFWNAKIFLTAVSYTQSKLTIFLVTFNSFTLMFCFLGINQFWKESLEILTFSSIVTFS